MTSTKWIPKATQLPMFSFRWFKRIPDSNEFDRTAFKNVAMIGLNNSKYKDWFFLIVSDSAWCRHQRRRQKSELNLKLIWISCSSAPKGNQWGCSAFAPHKRMFIFSVQKLKSTLQTAPIMTFSVRGCRHLAEWSPTHTHTRTDEHIHAPTHTQLISTCSRSSLNTSVFSALKERRGAEEAVRAVKDEGWDFSFM